jgi:hypothetical protein
MRPFFSPHIKFIPNALVIEYLGEFPAGRRILVRPAPGKDMDMFALPDLLQDGMIRKITHVM